MTDGGLTSADAAGRLRDVGPNDPAPVKSRSHLGELLGQLANPLIAILIFARVVSAFVGELINAAIIVVIVALGVAINFVQTLAASTCCAATR